MSRADRVGLRLEQKMKRLPAAEVEPEGDEVERVWRADLAQPQHVDVEPPALHHIGNDDRAMVHVGDGQRGHGGGSWGWAWSGTGTPSSWSTSSPWQPWAKSRIAARAVRIRPRARKAASGLSWRSIIPPPLRLRRRPRPSGARRGCC